jgi:hypothetical protein
MTLRDESLHSKAQLAWHGINRFGSALPVDDKQGLDQLRRA